MEEKRPERQFCYNLKLSDPQCQHCLWLEWNESNLACRNRKQMVCDLYLEEVFGNLISNTLN
jgi:hypothetical protein